jgi:hypothetical protein
MFCRYEILENIASAAIMFASTEISRYRIASFVGFMLSGLVFQ